MTDLVKIDEDVIISTATNSSTYQHYFYVTKGDKCANCKICLQQFEYDVKTTGTSSLNRHLQAKHPKVAAHKSKLKDAKKETPKANVGQLANYGFTADASTKDRLPPKRK